MQRSGHERPPEGSLHMQDLKQFQLIPPIAGLLQFYEWLEKVLEDLRRSKLTASHHLFFATH
jgi:hypothetical protein